MLYDDICGKCDICALAHGDGFLQLCRTIKL